MLLHRKFTVICYPVTMGYQVWHRSMCFAKNPLEIRFLSFSEFSDRIGHQNLRISLLRNISTFSETEVKGGQNNLLHQKGNYCILKTGFSE